MFSFFLVARGVVPGRGLVRDEDDNDDNNRRDGGIFIGNRYCLFLKEEWRGEGLLLCVCVCDFVFISFSVFPRPTLWIRISQNSY